METGQISLFLWCDVIQTRVRVSKAQIFDVYFTDLYFTAGFLSVNNCLQLYPYNTLYCLTLGSKNKFWTLL